MKTLQCVRKKISYFPSSWTVAWSLVVEIWNILYHPIIDLCKCHTFVNSTLNSFPNQVSIWHASPRIASWPRLLWWLTHWTATTVFMIGLHSNGKFACSIMSTVHARVTAMPGIRSTPIHWFEVWIFIHYLKHINNCCKCYELLFHAVKITQNCCTYILTSDPNPIQHRNENLGGSVVWQRSAATSVGAICLYLAMLLG